MESLILYNIMYNSVSNSQQYTCFKFVIGLTLNMWSVIKLFKHFYCNENSPLPIAVIEQLQTWGLIAKLNTTKCNKNHFLIIVSANCDYPDDFVWRCRKCHRFLKKNVRRNFKQSLQKNTFSINPTCQYQKLLFFFIIFERECFSIVYTKKIDIA